MGNAKKQTPEQIVNILRQIEVVISNGKTAPAASREARITVQTYYRWRKELEQENSKLKRPVAELSLDKQILQDIARGELLSPERRRAAVENARQQGVSERQCANWFTN